MSDKDLEVLSDVEFLITKRQVLSRIRTLLELTREELKPMWQESSFLGDAGKNIWSGKITQGENYRGLPYLILDYPAVFQGEDIFAARTMFWWGHFFSMTVHLQGAFFVPNRAQILDQLGAIDLSNLYICTADTPWHYHYGEDNYRRVEEVDLDDMVEKPFLKISHPITLDQWNLLPRTAVVFYGAVCSLLGDL